MENYFWNLGTPGIEWNKRIKWKINLIHLIHLIHLISLMN